MADPWALRQKAFKKTIYKALIEGKNLHRASCLHALSRPEIDHLSALAPKTPICLVPNGVDLRPFDQLPDRSVLETEIPALIGKFVLLFFGRFHTKKGLDLLPKALAAIAADWPELHIVMAGNDDGALAPFETAIESLGLGDARDDRRPCFGRTSAKCLGCGRRFHPAELFRRVQHGRP